MAFQVARKKTNNIYLFFKGDKVLTDVFVIAKTQRQCAIHKDQKLREIKGRH